MSKPIVRYKDVVTPVCVGHSAIVWPIDHPGDLVTNSGPVRTSPVVTCTAGSKGPLFETQNTYYKPDDDSLGNPGMDAEYVGFGVLKVSLRTEKQPEVVR